MGAKKLKPARELVDSFAAEGETLSQELLDSLLARGQEILPDLIAIVEDEELADVESCGEGFVPVHAARVLRELKAAEAVEAMLKTLARCDCADLLYGELIAALRAVGAQALEPVLKAHSQSDSTDYCDALADVLSGIGVRDERIFSIFSEMLKRDPELAAANFVDYGDPAAIALLSGLLDRCKPHSNIDPYANSKIIELSCAIEELGGKLSKHQNSLLKRAKTKPKLKSSPSKTPPKVSGMMSLSRPGVGVKIY